MLGPRFYAFMYALKTVLRSLALLLFAVALLVFLGVLCAG